MQSLKTPWHEWHLFAIDYIEQKTDYIFDVKDGAKDAHLVPYNVRYYVFNQGLMPRIFKKILLKMALIYDLDNVDETDNKKIIALANIYHRVSKERLNYLTNNYAQEEFFAHQFNILCYQLDLDNVFAIGKLVIDFHVIPFIEDARDMLL